MRTKAFFAAFAWLVVAGTARAKLREIKALASERLDELRKKEEEVARVQAGYEATLEAVRAGRARLRERRCRCRQRSIAGRSCGARS